MSSRSLARQLPGYRLAQDHPTWRQPGEIANTLLKSIPVPPEVSRKSQLFSQYCEQCRLTRNVQRDCQVQVTDARLNRLSEDKRYSVHGLFSGSSHPP